MAGDKKISQLDSGSPAQDTDGLAAARSGATIEIKVGDIRAAAARIAVLTEDGTINVPPWATKAYVTATAPGGGGGPSSNNRSTAGGGGSSGMSVNRKLVAVTPGGTITAACSDWSGGAGGTPGNNGGDGAQLVLAGTAGVSETLEGGLGGEAAPDSDFDVGMGGASSGTGSQAGYAGFSTDGAVIVMSGAGGGSPFGPGAPARSLPAEGAAQNGHDATFPGTGGGGGISADEASTAMNGGKGGPAYVVVEFEP